MTRDADDLFAALDRLLEEERAALLTGRLHALADILVDKAQLIDALQAAGPADAARDMAELRTKAVRNQELMDNAMRGIRAVANRLGTMRRLRRSLDTYDESGRRTTISTQGGSQMEKRA
ncbi:flagellar biosynthesis protein FlgN [Pseudooceanicola sp. LIPI14-2-Ac024]|uniref:flagellar biosynthesis protein FlgN n=1 Tax=Pseudooceanicola sp. LIPI14-2-Ac024 TaxID=3344875 RepID=UPI0035CEE41B